MARFQALTIGLVSVATLAIASCSEPGFSQTQSSSQQDVSNGSIHVAAGEDLSAIVRNLPDDGGPAAIVLGPGRHLITDTLELPSNTVLRGLGHSATILEASSELEILVTNTDHEAGNTSIQVEQLTIDCAGRAERGAYLVRVSDLSMSDVHITQCLREGMRVTGKGQRTRGYHFTNVTARDNRGDGLIFMWATRNAHYVNLASHSNGGRGILFDHSEFQATNISACDNAGHGIHVRNFFAANLDGLYACRNGRHGIFAVGMVASTGSGWVAQANSRSAHGQFDEIHFSSRDDLSYGVSAASSVAGIAVGAYHAGFGAPTARHGLFIGPEVDMDLSGINYSPVLGQERCDDCTE